MKRIFTIIALVAMGMFAMAQTNQLVWSNGRLIYGTSIETIDSLTYGEMEDIDTLHLLLPRTIIKVVYDTVYVHDTVYINNCDTTPIVPETTHAYVDLGLPSGLKWATCNVGADSPEEYGDYFAWGEVEPKETYNWSTYKYCNGSSSTLIKYCNNSSCGNYGFTDNKTVLDPEDDAATVNWGGNWRMPTKAEQDELRNNCTWDWTTQNGVKGYKVTGPNGNSIFLPAAGYMYEGTLDNAGSYGNYWSSSLLVGTPYYAYNVDFNWDGVDWDYTSRCYGQSVRPVCQ